MGRLFIIFFLGWTGAHKFVDGKIGMGFLYLFTFGLFGIGWIVDIIITLVGVCHGSSAPTRAPSPVFSEKRQQSSKRSTDPEVKKPESVVVAAPEKKKRPEPEATPAKERTSWIDELADPNSGVHEALAKLKEPNPPKMESVYRIEKVWTKKIKYEAPEGELSLRIIDDVLEASVPDGSIVRFSLSGDRL